MCELWDFPPPPKRGHYEHVPYGPYLCVLVNEEELRISLWRKTASERHYCHVAYNGKTFARPTPEEFDDDEDGRDPAQEFVPLPVEEFHRLKMIAHHVRTQDAWLRQSRRIAERMTRNRRNEPPAGGPPVQCDRRGGPTP